MGKRILLVDDEPLMLKGLKYTLEQEGYETDLAMDGEEALEVLDRYAPEHKSLFASLAGKDLIVEHAAGLTAAVQNELDDLMEKDRSGMIVVLIETPDNLEALHAPISLSTSTDIPIG